MKKIRVLHVFECFRQGGIENFVMNVYRNIDRDKVQFDFAFITRIDGVFDQEAKDLGGNIYYFDTEEKSFSNYKRSLTRIIKEHGPYEVVHSHMYFFSGYILSIAKSCGVKVRIAHSHDTEKGRKRTITREIYEKIMRVMIRRNATNLIGCSDLAAKYVFGNNAKYSVLYNGIDVDRFSFNAFKRNELRAKLKLENKKVLLNIGRFNVQKNHYFMLDFFASLVSSNESYIIILIGTGDLIDDIRDYTVQKGISENVIILSNIYNVEDYYCAADGFVLPSKYEGMPIVSVEAQCAGLPSLLSDRITKEVKITDIIDYLPIDNDGEEWVNRINDVLSHDVDRSKYYEIIRDSQFNIKRTVDYLTKVYESGDII